MTITTHAWNKAIYIYTLDRQGNDRTFNAADIEAKGGRTPRQQFRTICESIDRAAAEGIAHGLYEVRLLARTAPSSPSTRPTDPGVTPGAPGGGALHWKPSTKEN
jgi:hypothetical protein